MNNLKSENSNDAAIILADLHLSFGDKKILQGLNLKVKKGEIVAIMGPSGCGKSTLSKIIVGLLSPQQGDVQVSGDKIAMSFQNGALFTSLTIGENIDLVLTHNTDLDEEDRKKQIDKVLDLVGLLEDRDNYPEALSGGMAKRAGIARAIAIEPELMLYDEPSAGLDPITAHKLDQDLRDINEKLGMTTLLVTHELDSVRTMASRVALLYEGQIRFDGTSEEFFSSDNEYAVQFREGLKEGPFTATNNKGK